MNLHTDVGIYTKPMICNIWNAKRTEESIRCNVYLTWSEDFLAADGDLDLRWLEWTGSEVKLKVVTY